MRAYLATSEVRSGCVILKILTLHNVHAERDSNLSKTKTKE